MVPSTEAFALSCASSYFQVDGVFANVCDLFFSIMVCFLKCKRMRLMCIGKRAAITICRSDLTGLVVKR